ncbi:hypothetical protein GCM10027440_39080 [Nocardiopsis coralliicola]
MQQLPHGEGRRPAAVAPKGAVPAIRRNPLDAGGDSDIIDTFGTRMVRPRGADPLRLQYGPDSVRRFAPAL